MKDIMAGIDIGGTKIRSVLARGSRVIAAREARTPARQEILEVLLRDIMSDLSRRGARRIGISAAGVIQGNVIRVFPNIPSLRNVRPARLAPWGTRVRVDNDARCFARAEAVLGAARGSDSACAFILGTGVGRSYVKNGLPRNIKRFERPELWEAGYKRLKSGPARTLANFLAPNLARIIAEFQPAVVVLGGGTLRKPDLFDLLSREMQNAGVRCPIRRSRFRQNGPAMGAALVAAEKDNT